MTTIFGYLKSMKFKVLVILCLQNSIFTVLRRYSLGIREEKYSKYECLMVGEIIKMIFSVYMISLVVPVNHQTPSSSFSLREHLIGLILKSHKMLFLAFMYGAMNVLSFVALRNIGAGLFTIFAQCKILSTTIFSALILGRQYSWTKWRALAQLGFSVLLFSEPILSDISLFKNGNPALGVAAVLIEVTTSGFASIYFEKVIKVDTENLNIWERNFQLAMWSVPTYICFIMYENGGEAGYGGGWSGVTFVLSCLGAAGGLLVALSIKYGDSVLKTLATTGSIILSSLLDRLFLGAPLTPVMCIAAVLVVLAICNYTFDATTTEPVINSTLEAEKLLKKEKNMDIPAATDDDDRSVTSNDSQNMRRRTSGIGLQTSRDIELKVSDVAGV